MTQIYNPEPIRRGCAWNADTFLYKNTDGSAVNINGFTPKVVIYDSNGAVKFTLLNGSGLTVNDAAGSVKPVLTDAQVLSVPAGTYKYTYFLTAPGGTETTAMVEGTLDLVHS